MQTNNSSNMLRNKQEQFAVQIRKERREEIFKQKRVIIQQPSPMEQMNPETFEQETKQLMDECLNIYKHKLPQDFQIMMNNLTQLRRRQLNDKSGTFILCLFQKDFISFLLLILNEQFDHVPNLQIECGTILANFYGSIEKNSKYYLASYIPMLNVLGEIIVKNFGRLLYSRNSSLIDTCLYALGNVFLDNNILIQQFKKIFGLKYLMQVSAHLNTVVWVLDTITGNKEYFSNEEMQLALSILDQQFKSNNLETQEHCINAINNLSFHYDVIALIIQMECFPKVTELAFYSSDPEKQKLHFIALEIMFQISKLTDFEKMSKLQQKYNFIEFYITNLSSHYKEYKIQAMIALKNLCNLNESFAIQISKIPYSFEKIRNITMSNEQKIIESGILLIRSMLQYNLIEMNQSFVNQNLVSLLSHLLTYLNDQIIESALEVLYILLETIDYYQSPLQIEGEDNIKSKVYILNLLNKNNIIDQLTQVFQNRDPDHISDLINECLDRIEKAQQDVDNY